MAPVTKMSATDPQSHVNRIGPSSILCSSVFTALGFLPGKSMISIIKYLGSLAHSSRDESEVLVALEGTVASSGREKKSSGC